MADDATLEESVGKMTELITDLKGCLEKFKDKPKLVSCESDNSSSLSV